MMKKTRLPVLCGIWALAGMLVLAPGIAAAAAVGVPVAAGQARSEELPEDDRMKAGYSVQFPLTGLFSIGQKDVRPIAVMVENSPAARPQSGLGDADVVYEILAEGDITRFVAFYHSRVPGKVGPVRSIRPYYVDVAAAMDAVLVHAGWSQEAMNRVAAGGVDHFDEVYGDRVYYWRSPDRKPPHNLYTSIEGIRRGMEKKQLRTAWTPVHPVFAGEPVRGEDKLAPDSVGAATGAASGDADAAGASAGVAGAESGGAVGVASGVAGAESGGAAGVASGVAGAESGGAAGVASGVAGAESGGAAGVASGVAGAESGGAAEAEALRLPYSAGYAVSYVYDAVSGQYLRRMNGLAHADAESDRQLAAANVLVCRSNHRVTDSAGRRQVDVQGSGSGYVLTGGMVQEAVWQLRDGLVRTYAADGQEIPLAPGVTWIQFVPVGMEVELGE
ncbi:DUF3048 domain-containing protein [Paenibacillus sp. YN15]|uniref:DUF3048 domain-containing protein n=1 Tax=Paenibacillus sp. YN15 TaxID=1742774 RepID=UPI000DCDC760|nr:DUF3048 domain-containing protein [Paenibacillus sp. YN15]RAU93870.1 hypothetical protein DQG13_25005 [Paenibacillus sp. YN15]